MNVRMLAAIHDSNHLVPWRDHLIDDWQPVGAPAADP